MNSKILPCPLINEKLCVIFNIILRVCEIGAGTRPPPGTWKAWNLDSLQGRSTEQESGVNKLAITANNIDAGLGNYTVTQGTQNKYTIVFSRQSVPYKYLSSFWINNVALCGNARRLYTSSV